MRKLFNLFTIGALLLTMASCDGNDANNPENPELNTKYFTVEISAGNPDPDDGGRVYFTITPTELVTKFFYNIFSKEMVDENGLNSIEGILSYFEANNRPLNLETNKGGSVQTFLYYNKYEFDKEYVVFAFAYDENDKPIADSWTTRTFRTPEKPEREGEEVVVPEITNLPTGAIRGLFSVPNGKFVYFSKGNLRYYPDNMTWEFADKQYWCVGNGNSDFGKDPMSWYDLFGWGTGDNPLKSSENDDDYATFTDWGDNPIRNGGNQPKQWRTLASYDMEHILEKRKDAEKLHGYAFIEDGANGYVKGYVLLPDNWQAPNGLTFNASKTYANADKYTQSQWTDMETNGAVFLPAAGTRIGATVTYVNVYGDYWTKTYYRSSGDEFTFVEAQNEQQEAHTDMCSKRYGCSVRLVQDYQE